MKYIGLVAMLFLLAFAGCVAQPAGEEEGTAKLAPQTKLLLEDTLAKVVALSNNGQEVDVEIVKEEPLGAHLLNLTVSIEGNPQPVNVFVTADGKYIIFGSVAEVAQLKKEVEAQLAALKEGTPIGYNIELKGPVKGNPNAKVAIVEFSDFQCPYCHRFWQATLPQLEQNYISTGKIAFYYRDFPLITIHPGAKPAAIAAYCAGQQGKYWEYHDKLFENAQSLSSADKAFFVGLAEEVGLNTTAFSECLDSQEAEGYVEESFTQGSQYGVGGTPTFFIVVSKDIPKEKVIQAARYIPGGKLLIAPDQYVIMFSGAYPYEVLDRALSTLLEGTQ